jgi:hydrogenase maturation protease
VTTLVAGVGNVFLGDDGWGVEVARRLAGVDLPEGVKVADFGIRGVHLAYELLDGYDEVVLIDAAPRGETPGTVYVIEPEIGDVDVPPLVDAHGMEPQAVLGLLHALGGNVDRVVVVGCEPADVAEGMGLSGPAEKAVDQAVELVRSLLWKEE